jgi:hypothetical protein
LLNLLGILTHHGEGHQQDMTINLLWANAAAMLDDAFQDFKVDFTALISSDHTGLQIKYQHAMDSAIEQTPHLPSYLICDDAKDQWTCHLNKHFHYAPFKLSSTTLIDQADNHLTQEIEETCQAVFEKWKVFSSRAAAWWDEECSKATAAVQEAPSPETWKQSHKTLVKAVQKAKHHWANKFLHNASPEHLWTTARWCLGHRQRLIPALATTDGLTDEPHKMADALQSCFFKSQPCLVLERFLDDLPLARMRQFVPIVTAKIADAL